MLNNIESMQQHLLLIRIGLEIILYTGGIRKDEKKPYKILAVSAFLIMTTTYALTPIATFAIETEQTNTGDMSLSANEEKMKKNCTRCWVICKGYE